MKGSTKQVGRNSTVMTKDIDLRLLGEKYSTKRKIS